MKQLLIYIAAFSIFTITAYGDPALNSDKNIQLYPNPAIDYIHVKLNNLTNIDHIKIYNSKGELVDLLTSVFQENKIDLQSYLPGRYMVLIFLKNGVHKETFEVSEKTTRS